MKRVIVTGQSGAGKSLAVDFLEELGYFCVDNLPPELILKFNDLIGQTGGRLEKSAMVCDIRSGEVKGLEDAIEELEAAGTAVEILYLGASDEVLVKRYKETRRTHPLSGKGNLVEGIQKERKLFEKIKSRATYDIDTSNLNSTQLKSKISQYFSESSEGEGITVNVNSFGFKYGIPLDSDLVFDVRFLPNPFYIPSMKHKTGLDDEVFDYVMGFGETLEFLKKLCDMVEYLIPLYTEEGKKQLVISVGCTGGHHRSVAIAESLGEALKKTGKNVYISHRDIQKSV